MIGWEIALAILLPIFFLLLLRVRVIFSYKESVRAYLSILFFKIPLYPRRKKVKVCDYTYRRHRKRLAAQRKKQAEKAAATQARKKRKPSFVAQIRYYASLIKYLYPRFLRHFRMDITRLHVRVGTGDAASTAILTGVASQALAFLLEFLSLHTNVHPTHRADIAVTPDFLSERSTADCKIVFSLRVYAIIGLGIRFFRHLLTEKTKTLRPAQNKEDTSCLKTN